MAGTCTSKIRRDSSGPGSRALSQELSRDTLFLVGKQHGWRDVWKRGRSFRIHLTQQCPQRHAGRIKEQ